MKTAQKEILKKVKAILKVHPSGEKFFDALDGQLINEASPAVYRALFKMVPKGSFLVLSGGFGKRVANGIDDGSFPKFSYILYEGGIRSGKNPTVIRTSGNLTGNGVFLDDSIYGGATYYKIKEHMKGNISFCAVVYDGCPVLREDVKSIFRYYDHFKSSTPNYSF